MNSKSIKFKEFIKRDDLTFLVGAGCSHDSPSNIPLASEMMECIIRYICDKSETKKILKLKKLRFEQLIEIMQNLFDNNLNILNYIELCDRPNLHHFFLAKMIEKGNFVMTTNFDFLIEYALLKLNIPKNQLKIIITKEDFELNNNPALLFQQGIKTLYKIHGSSKNIISNEDTRKSLIATIRALGRNKQGLNIFQIEPFKRQLFNNISKNRSIIILGYSGTDDFDIIPTLKQLKNIKNFLWVNHIEDDETYEIINEIEIIKIREENEFNQLDRLLMDIKRMTNVKKVYRIDANTTRLISNIIDERNIVKSKDFSIEFYSWLKKNLNITNKVIKLFFAHEIYFTFDLHDDALRCAKKIYRLTEKSKNKWNLLALNNIGLINYYKGNYPEALKYYKEAINKNEYYNDPILKADLLNNIGMVYKMQSNYHDALKCFNKAEKIFSHMNSAKIAVIQINIASIYEIQGDFSKATKYFQNALSMSEQTGELLVKAIILNDIANIYKEQGNYQDALKLYNEAKKIFTELGAIGKKLTILNNMGIIYGYEGDYDKGLKSYNKALKIAEKQGDLSGKASVFNNIGNHFQDLGDLKKAFKYYNKALFIDGKLNNLAGKATRLNNIADVYREEGNLSNAFNYYMKALKLNEKLGRLMNKAFCINNIGLIHLAKAEYHKALKFFQNALNLLNELGLSESKNASNIKKNIEIAINSINSL